GRLYPDRDPPQRKTAHGAVINLRHIRAEIRRAADEKTVRRPERDGRWRQAHAPRRRERDRPEPKADANLWWGNGGPFARSWRRPKSCPRRPGKGSPCGQMSARVPSRMKGPCTSIVR